MTGVVLGVYASHDWNQQIQMGLCQNINGRWKCPDAVHSATNQDHTLGTVGTFVGLGGLGLAAVGTYLWFFGPHEERLTFMPRLDPEHAGIVALGRF